MKKILFKCIGLTIPHPPPYVYMLRFCSAALCTLKRNQELIVELLGRGLGKGRPSPTGLDPRGLLTS